MSELTGAYERARVGQNDELRDVQRFFDRHFLNGRLRRVLDAGAGFNLPLDIPRSAHLVAIDLDREALARNENADEKVVGDIEQLDRTGLHDFDAIICWWVLEHVRTPSAAVVQLANALRPGGLLILGVPYYWGFKAVVTKLTPFWFHLYMARRADPLAGTPGYGPYPTNLRRDISPKALDRIAAEHRLISVFQRTYSTQPEDRLSPPARGLWVGAGKLIQTVTRGRYDPLMSEHIAIYERR
jgi:2-polyprenyl-3-methyl-5-hydroxy-6-metoxy-1,4-benzoquinol methylase